MLALHVASLGLTLVLHNCLNKARVAPEHLWNWPSQYRWLWLKFLLPLQNLSLVFSRCLPYEEADAHLGGERSTLGEGETGSGRPQRENLFPAGFTLTWDPQCLLKRDPQGQWLKGSLGP